MSYGEEDCPFDTKAFDRGQERVVMDNIISEPMKVSDDIEAPAYYSKGFDKFPIFDVDQDDFNATLTANRQQMNFKADTPVNKYMKADTQQRSTFYVRTTDKKGQQFIRRVK